MVTADACLAVKLVLPEPDSHLAVALWEEWTDGREEIIVPPFFMAEALSVVRKWVHFGNLSVQDGDQAAVVLSQLNVDLQAPADLYVRAWDLAQRFNQPTIYDCCYLALAVITGSALWTADGRFANAVRGDFPRVRLLGE